MDDTNTRKMAAIWIMKAQTDYSTNLEKEMEQLCPAVNYSKLMMIDLRKNKTGLTYKTIIHSTAIIKVQVPRIVAVSYQYSQEKHKSISTKDQCAQLVFQVNFSTPIPVILRSFANKISYANFLSNLCSLVIVLNFISPAICHGPRIKSVVTDEQIVPIYFRLDCANSSFVTSRRLNRSGLKLAFR